MSSRYDAVVVGSGIGGLTSGAFLARAGMRVLVLEQHTQIGGYAHGFKRRSFTFESAVHSVAMNKNGMLFHLLRLLGIDNEIEVLPFSSMFTTVSHQGRFVMPASRDEILPALCSAFPGEREGLERLLKDMSCFHEALLTPILDYETALRVENTEFIKRYYNLSYRDYIRGFLKDERACNAFFSQWPFVGSSPDYAPVIFSVLMFYVHLCDGSHYVKGGFRALAAALEGAIIAQGGEVRTRARVEAIRTSENRARAVVLAGGEEMEANVVISNISPYRLHGELLDQESRNKLWLRRLSTLRPSLSAVVAYLGLQGRLCEVSDGVTVWYESDDHEAIFKRALGASPGPVDHLIFLKAPMSGDRDTVTLMTFVSQHMSDNWHNDKEAFVERMLQRAEILVPGLRKRIACIETGSPSTFERYTGNTEGALYGFENSKVLYREAKLPVTTHIANLYQTGHWGKPGGGIWNVMQNGYAASKVILRGN